MARRETWYSIVHVLYTYDYGNGAKAGAELCFSRDTAHFAWTNIWIVRHILAIRDYSNSSIVA